MKRNRAIPLPTLTDEAVCLLWFQSLPSPYSSLSLNIIREIHYYWPAVPLLVEIRQDSILLVTVPDFRYTRNTRPELISASAQFLLFSQWNALVFQGNSASQQVHTFNLLTFSVSPYSDLITARAFPGTICIEKKVYVVAGVGQKGSGLLEFERTNTKKGSWKGLPNCLLPHICVNLSHFNSEIYVWDWHCHHSLELFSIPKAQFRLIQKPIAIDERLLVDFPIANQLIGISSRRQVHTWVMEGDSVFRRPISAAGSMKMAPKKGLSEVKVSGQGVYWLYDWTMYRFDLVSEELTKQQIA